MRILHTSDWHLGRKFGDHPLIDDQSEFLEWFVGVAVERSIDVVIVAGDLYDRSMPPSEAVQLFGNTLRALHDAGIGFVGIAGNHDGAARVAALDGLTDASGVILRGGYSRSGDVTVIQAGESSLAVVAVPFLDPLLSPDVSNGRLSHEEVLRRALDTAREGLDDDHNSIVIAHAFVSGCSPSDSERELSVGTAGMVSSKLFEGFDYVALGHLHSPQMVSGSEQMRYSGSPLAYSFSETAQKSVYLVEMSASGFESVETIPIPVGRSVQTLRGSIAELLEQPPSELWTRIELTDEKPVLDAQRRLREIYPYVVEITRDASSPESDGGDLSMAEARALAPQELAAAFWLDVVGEKLSHEQQELISAALSPDGVVPS